MTSIDLRQYVVASTGSWLKDEANFQPTLLRLAGPEDGLTLVGPLRVRLCVLALNRLTQLSAHATSVQSKDVWSYTLEIPPGQSWTYPSPQEYGAVVQHAEPGGGGGGRGARGASGTGSAGSAGGAGGGTETTADAS